MPIIETARLTLRGPVLADIDASIALWGDPRVTRYITGKPLGPEDVWGRFYRMVGHWRVRGYGYWIACDRESGRSLGEIGFGEFRRALDPELQGLAELGWVLHPDSHGRGYATEAARAALDWIDQNHRPDRTVCLIAPENLASSRVAQKCGYTEFTRTSYKDLPAIILDRRRPGATSEGLRTEQ